MPIDHNRLGQAQINSGSKTTLLTVAASQKVIVKTIIVSNTSTLDQSCEIWDVKNGDSPDDKNLFFPGLTIPANDFIQIRTHLVLDTEGDTLQAEASLASSISIQVYGGIES